MNVTTRLMAFFAFLLSIPFHWDLCFRITASTAKSSPDVPGDSINYCKWTYMALYSLQSAIPITCLYILPHETALASSAN